MNHFHNLTGEQKEQLLLLCDKKGKVVGTDTRENCHAGVGKTHLAFMAFVTDKNNNVILTKRSAKKSLWGGFWDAPNVSHVLPGETVEEAACRRGKEELGVDVNFKAIGAFYYFAKHGNSCENEYCFILKGNTQKNIHPNPVEIEATKLMTWNDLVSDITENSHKYTPWLQSAIRRNISHFNF